MNPIKLRSGILINADQICAVGRNDQLFDLSRPERSFYILMSDQRQYEIAEDEYDALMNVALPFLAPSPSEENYHEIDPT